MEKKERDKRTKEKERKNARETEMSKRTNPEAARLIEQANKALNRFFSFGTGKYEEAADLFNQAGNLYKASKMRKKTNKEIHKTKQQQQQQKSVLANRC